MGATLLIKDGIDHLAKLISYLASVIFSSCDVFEEITQMPPQGAEKNKKEQGEMRTFREAEKNKKEQGEMRTFRKNL